MTRTSLLKRNTVFTVTFKLIHLGCAFIQCALKGYRIQESKAGGYKMRNYKK